MKKNYEIVEHDVCGTCKHFHRHYVRHKTGRFSPLHYGHCVYPRLKRREPDRTCPHWTAREEPEEARPQETLRAPLSPQPTVRG